MDDPGRNSQLTWVLSNSVIEPGYLRSAAQFSADGEEDE